MLKHVWILILLSCCAAAQNRASTAVLQSVASVREGADLRVEMTLSAPAVPSIQTTAHRDRILIDFPNTSTSYRNIAVNQNGVRRIRSDQHSTNPPVTRVTLDLDRAHSYILKMEGDRAIVVVSSLDEPYSASRRPLMAATSGNLIGVFRRHEKIAITAENSAAEPPPVPLATTGAAEQGTPPNGSSPAQFPPKQPNPVSQSQSGISTQGLTGRASVEQYQRNNERKDDTAQSSASRLVSAPGPVAPAFTTASVGPTEPVPPTSAAATSVPAAETTMISRTDDPSLRTVFKVKYVAEGVAYLEGGRAQGLTEGMKLEVEDTTLPAKQGDSVSATDPRVIADLEVAAVAESSAVTDIHSPKRPVKAGDLAYLSSGDTEALVQQRALSPTRQYPAVVSFTEGDTLDDEVREEIPRPPLPSVNRARGRVGFDTIETISHGSSNVTSSDIGMVFRGDITRIGCTYWNLSGYWRGQLTKASAASQHTLQNLMNRTYHLNMTYDNPNSSLVAGFGRLYLPWASSLDTIDGGYFGKRLSKMTTAGVFGGSTPDPSSWSYSPNRVIGGVFLNFEGGQYDGFHYSSTTGAGISMVNWTVDRPFVFLEDTLSYKRDISIYESAQLDRPKGNSATPSPGSGLGRNFLTLRVNPHPRAELDFNYNYFRDVPTFDSALVGTGLLDKYLFQGFSAGARVEIKNQIWLSTTLGRSSGTGDTKASLNEMYGVAFGRLPYLNLRADIHYARFNGSFGNGSYKAFSLSRQMSDRFRLEVLMGQQNFTSTLTNNTRGRFLTGTVETTLGPHYYLQGSFTTNRGNMNYDQMMFSFGYRFDSKRRGE